MSSHLSGSETLSFTTLLRPEDHVQWKDSTVRCSSSRSSGLSLKARLTKHIQVVGKTFGVYLGLAQADIETILFESMNTHQDAPAEIRHQRMIDFASKFSPLSHGNRMFTALVIVKDRRLVISGTYDQALHERNQALESIGCYRVFKGDIGVCFLGKREPERFLHSMPRFFSGGGNRLLLKRGLDV